MDLPPPGDRMLRQPGPQTWAVIGVAVLISSLLAFAASLYVMPEMFVSGFGLTAGAYLAGSAVVGHPFNNYWGLIDAPLLASGFVRSPASVRDLIVSIIHPSESGRSIGSSATERASAGSLSDEPAPVPANPTHPAEPG